MSFPNIKRDWGAIASDQEVNTELIQGIVDEIEAIEYYLTTKLIPTMVPAVPRSLTYSWNTEGLLLNWLWPADDKYVQKFIIDIHSAETGGVLYRQESRIATSYLWTYANQLDDTSDTLDPSVYVEVRALTYSGWYSEAASVTATNDAPNPPTGASEVFTEDHIVITIPELVDEDIKEVKYAMTKND